MLDILVDTMVDSCILYASENCNDVINVQLCSLLPVNAVFRINFDSTSLVKKNLHYFALKLVY